MARPTEIVAGDSYEWIESLAEYPASAGWELAFAVNGTSARYSFPSVASGDEFAIALTAATTASWAAGDYRLVGAVTKGAERKTVIDDRVKVTPDLAGALAPIDTRSHAERTLEKLNAAIEGRASATDLKFEIAGRSIEKMPHSELIAARDRYAALVAGERRRDRARRSGDTGRTVRGVFRNAR